MEEKYEYIEQKTKGLRRALKMAEFGGLVIAGVILTVVLSFIFWMITKVL